jgi:hypothetical protein
LPAKRPRRSTVEGGRSSAALTKRSSIERSRPSGRWQRGEAPWKEDGHRPDEPGGVKPSEGGFRPAERSGALPGEDGHSVVQPKRSIVEGARSACRPNDQREASWKEDGHRPLSRRGAASREAGFRVGGSEVRHRRRRTVIGRSHEAEQHRAKPAFGSVAAR